MAEHEQPIIIKKVKKGGHGGHHGGAWKVAYADFVTAMMAFFLVMWILGLSPTEKKRIANFFREPGIFDNETGRKIPLPLEMSFGSRGNEGNGAGNVGMNASNMDLDQKFNNANSSISDSLKNALASQAVSDSISLAERIMTTAAELRQEIQQMKQQFPEMKDLLDNVKITISDEGLRIELVEVKDNVFFDVGSSTLKPAAVKLLRDLAGYLGKLQHHIVLEGHTDSKQFPGSRTGYSNWELSSDRANSARKVLESNGIDPTQIINVVACADKHPVNTVNPFDPSNRRVSIVIPNITSEELLKQKLTEHGGTGHHEQPSTHATITGTIYK